MVWLTFKYLCFFSIIVEITGDDYNVLNLINSVESNMSPLQEEVVLRFIREEVVIHGGDKKLMVDKLVQKLEDFFPSSFWIVIMNYDVAAYPYTVRLTCSFQNNFVLVAGLERRKVEVSDGSDIEAKYRGTKPTATLPLLPPAPAENARNDSPPPDVATAPCYQKLASFF